MLDGAMGTMIQQYGLTEEDFRREQFKDVPGLMKGNNDILCLTRPDVIADIHRKYLDAGADLITTCTFSSQRVSMADYQVEEYCREMNLAGAKIARTQSCPTLCDTMDCSPPGSSVHRSLQARILE